MNGYFSRFVAALVASIALIALDAAIPLLPSWFALSPVLPLMGYHLAYLYPRAKDLRPAAIDSVYYLGFLITVTALAAAAFQIAGARQTDIAPVLQKFAAGLLATAYAVIARLHVQSVARSEVTDTPEQTLETYLKRSDVLLDNVEMAILRFGALADTALAETQKVANNASGLLKDNAASTMKAFDAALRTTLSSIQENASQARSVLTDTTFMEEREAFASTLRTSIKVSAAFTKSLDTLARSATDGGVSFERMSTAMESLGVSAETLHARISELTGAHGALEQSAANFTSAADASKRAAESAQAASTRVADLARTVTAIGPNFDRLASSAQNVEAQLGSITVACGSLNASVEQLGDALKAAHQLSATLEQVARELPSLSPKFQGLGRDFDSLRVALASAADSLEADVQRSARAVGLLAENLAAVAETIVERTRERQAGRA